MNLRALVTGSEGSLGRALCDRLEAGGWVVSRFDIARHPSEDVTKRISRTWSRMDVIFHLAAAKHAPEGELDPWETTRINVQGTRNVLELGARTILASTCKAADPETVYGATKLIAERMVLAAGGSVARFYNVPESAGNVFETWRDLPALEPIPVTPCARYFMGLEAAVDLLTELVDQRPGRYTIDPGSPELMVDVARRLYPDRALEFTPARRGDRFSEPRHARCELLAPMANGLERITCHHDPHHQNAAQEAAVA